MDMHLKNKVVVVTGGSAGIGKAVALGFAREGAKVAICARNPNKLQAVQDEFKALGYELYAKSVDVAESQAIGDFADDVAAHYGRIDIWINNVGMHIDCSILETRAERWNDVMIANVNSCFFGIQAAAKHMKETGGGTIINTSSVASKLPSAYKSAYGTSKYAVNGLTQASAGELAPFGIRVNAVAPGSTNTEMAKKSGKDYSKALKVNAIQRLAEPEEIANAYLFLASDAASYITGEVLHVDGGKFVIQDCENAFKQKR